MAASQALAAAVGQYTEQAPVTALPERAALTVAVVGVTALAMWLMWRNWRKRIARQGWVQLHEVPEGFTPRVVMEARYVASVRTQDWLDRIAAQGLGMPGAAAVAVGPAGVLVRRHAEPDVFLPAGRIVEITSARGMAQEVYERDGIVAITWRTGEGSVTTGLRMSRPEDHVALMGMVSDMIGKAEV